MVIFIFHFSIILVACVLIPEDSKPIDITRLPLQITTQSYILENETTTPESPSTSSQTSTVEQSLQKTNDISHDQKDTFSKPGWIAFTWRSEEESESEIYKIKTDKSDLENLTNLPGFDEYPAWSPDGTQIAFVSNRAGKSHLYLMDEYGKNPTRISEMTPIYNKVSWSPDGQKLVFASKGVADSSDIYIIDLRNNEVENITNSPYMETSPDWSPDGQGILFVACNDEDLSDEFAEECFLHVMDFETKHIVPVSNTSDFVGGRWSPDSKKILSACNLNLCIIDSDGSKRIEFDKSLYKINFHEPTWSPNGQSVAFVSLGNYDEGIYLLDLIFPSTITNVVRITPTNLAGSFYGIDWKP